jgi:hypothetical protein
LATKLTKENNLECDFKNFRFQYFDHILNLVAQAALDEMRKDIDKVFLYISFYFIFYYIFIYINYFIA